MERSISDSRRKRYRRHDSRGGVWANIGTALALCLKELGEWLVPAQYEPETPDARIITLRKAWRTDGSHDR